MVVQFFRLVIEGTNETKLNAIKDWLDTRIDNNDLDEYIGGGEVLVYEDDFSPGDYILSLDMYVKSTVNKNKYKDIIITEFTSLNKDGLTHAYIDKYDDCSHDSNNPQPCVITRVLEWNN